MGENPAAIDVSFLERFPEFIEFKALRHEKEEESPAAGAASAPDTGKTPHEALEAAYDRLRSELAAEILSTIKVSEPAVFEEIVVDLLVKMGYGGSRKDAGQAIGRRGDEGIDGIIKEDRLGLDIIYIQVDRARIQHPLARLGAVSNDACMTREQVESAITSGAPFTLRMADGKEYAVPHRDYIWLPPRASYVIVHEDDGHYTVLPLLTMTGLRSKAADAKQEHKKNANPG